MTDNRIKPMSLTERRWRDNTGQRYLVDGVTVRCQAVSKTRLRKEREDTDNSDLTSEDVWPRLQCMRAAKPGAFMCRFHGGKSLGMKRHRLLDSAPAALRENMDILLGNPDYLSRKRDIILFESYIWQLVEQLDNTGGRESWGEILSCVELLAEGADQAKYIRRIQEIAESQTKNFETMKEIRETAKILKDMTTAEVNSVEKLKTMASADQVAASFERFYLVAEESVKAYVSDPTTERNILKRIAAELRKFAGTIY